MKADLGGAAGHHLISFVTFHAKLDVNSSHLERPAELKQDGGAGSRLDMLELMGRSARLFHRNAQLTLLTDERSRFPGSRFAVRRYPAAADSLMLDRALAQAAYLSRYDFRAPVVLLDTDILLNGELSSLFADDFDIALTWREIVAAPINGGLILANNRRPEKVREFFSGFTGVYASRHGQNAAWFGDQDALMEYLEVTMEDLQESPTLVRHGARIRFLPGDVFNFSPLNSAFFIAKPLEDKRVLHFKGNRKWMMQLYWKAYLAPKEHPILAHHAGQRARSEIRRLAEADAIRFGMTLDD